MNTQVLIIGAGPTGLVLALYLAKLGVGVRIVDKTDGPGTTSRALVVQARNLEFYRQFGIAQHAVDAGLKFTALNLWANGEHVARVPFGDIGKGLSHYPYMLIYPQDKHEQMLVGALRKSGIEVERKTELVSFEQVGSFVRAVLRTPGGSLQTCEASYLAGCDGAHSTVREQLGLGFPGGAYSGLFYVADISGEGPPVNRELNVALDEADLLAIFPLKAGGNVRLVGNIRNTGKQDGLNWEDVSKRVIERLKLKVNKVGWFSTYHVHHRIASSFRRNSVFLLGDAAHIHSPVGGQGMNTGIGDAVNLAWKMAAVLQNRIDSSVLETFEPERIAFARRLVNTTDRVFQFVSSHGPIANIVRLQVVPLLIPRLYELNSVKRLMFRILSQIAIEYRASPLSAGLAGHVKGGDRLPWIELDGTGQEMPDNYAGFNSLDWQVHCYGEVTPAIRLLCENRGLTLRVFPWISRMRRVRLMRNALYLVRPDTHVGLAEETANPEVLERYLDEHKIRPIT